MMTNQSEQQSQAADSVRFFQIVTHFFDPRITIKPLFWSAHQSFGTNLISLFRVWRAMNKGLTDKPRWHFWYYEVKGNATITTYKRLQAVRSIVDNKCLDNGKLIPLF